MVVAQKRYQPWNEVSFHSFHERMSNPRCMLTANRRFAMMCMRPLQLLPECLWESPAAPEGPGEACDGMQSERLRVVCFSAKNVGASGQAALS